MKKYNILIVDDEDRLVQCLDFMLSLEGHNVIAKNNAKEALGILKESVGSDNAVDLLITDMYMPEMSGISLIDKLQQEKMTTKILGISGCPDNYLANELGSRNNIDFISKPFTPEKLLEKIMEIMD